MAKACKHPHNWLLGRLLLLALLPLAAGCGNGLVSVSGTVDLDGKPLAGAGVVFHPDGKGAPASGETDAQGHYHLQTGSGAGVLPGEYHVTISKRRISGISEDERVLPGGIKIESLVAPKFDDPKTSPLTATVKGGTKSYDFRVSAE
jgi:hypothetical protein